jgi:hypothetical protein
MGGGGAANQNGVYGTLGKPGKQNIPAGRYAHLAWIDARGHFWIFGGAVQDGDVNDLWEFNPYTSEWTWVSGVDPNSYDFGPFASGAPAVYGRQGIAARGNTPGAREDSTSWTDKDGHLWLFGGNGVDATSTFDGLLGDLWEFDPSTRLWAWMGGDSTAVLLDNGLSQPGIYGHFRVPAAANMPGGRLLANSWTDNEGHFWLFGGYGADSTGYEDHLNDLWEYTLPRVPFSE